MDEKDKEITALRMVYDEEKKAPNATPKTLTIALARLPWTHVPAPLHSHVPVYGRS